jgi:hypothetical protein
VKGIDVNATETKELCVGQWMHLDCNRKLDKFIILTCPFIDTNLLAAK